MSTLLPTAADFCKVLYCGISWEHVGINASSLACCLSQKDYICREAASTGHELDVPQQFGVWQIAGLGIVVAFRGTASQEDVIIDANISPVPLDLARSTRGMPSGPRAEAIIGGTLANIQAAEDVGNHAPVLA